MDGTITIEEAEAAFKKTGLKPVRSFTYSFEDNCGCIWAGMCVAETGFTMVRDIDIFAWAKNEYEPDYVMGVTRGWDSYHIPEGGTNPMLSRGIRDGKMLAAHFFKEQPNDV